MRHGSVNAMASSPGARRLGRLEKSRALYVAAFGLLALVFTLIGSTTGAVAGPASNALAKFAAGTFAATKKAVGELASAGLATAPAILDALANHRLRYDPVSKKVYMIAASGEILDARTGAKSVGVDRAGLKSVRIDNAVRSALQTAQSLVNLISPERNQRLSAARRVFETRDASALPAVRKALALESDPAVKNALEDAQAVLVAANPKAPEASRLAAVERVRRRGGDEALSFLSSLAPGAHGAFAAAIKAAIASVQTRLTLLGYVQNMWYGLSLGSVLLLAAIGLAITFGVMGVINMAHGEMVMLGAYCTFATQQILRTYAPSWMEDSLFLALPVAFIATAALGMAIERLIIRRLHHRPLETLLATFGLSLILQQAVRTLFGAQNLNVATPRFMAGSFKVYGLNVESGRMWIIVFAIGVFAALQVLLRTTPFGLRLRATTQNRRMAANMGISTGRIDALAFGLGSGIAGMAGVALSQIDNVSPNLGQSYIIDSFLVVVFGGVGNLWGTLVAALTLGVANKLIEPAAGAVLGKIALLVFIILFIQKRPRGLFPVKGRAAEA